MKRQMMASVVAVTLVCGAGAKTVALWPLSAKPDSTYDGRCAINPANNLSFGQNPSDTWRQPTTGPADWSLPPNPDTDFHVFEPYSYGRAISSTTAATSGTFPVAGNTKIAKSDSPALYRALYGVESSCTIEGWFRIDEDLTEGDGYWEICEFWAGGSTNEVDYGSRTFLSIRYNNKDESDNFYCDLESYMQGPNEEGGDHRGYAIIADPQAFVGVWHHIAFVREILPAGGVKESYYLDGALFGETSGNDYSPKIVADERVTAYIGGRKDRHRKCALTYWRVSDEALVPGQFLCDSGVGPKTYGIAEMATVAYWPLRKKADDSLDFSDKVSGEKLQGPVLQGMEEMELDYGVSAFKGDPPNEAIKISGRTLSNCVPNGNQDSLGAWKYPTFVRIYKLNDLTRANPHQANFTLECYYRPAFKERQTAIETTDESVATFYTSMNAGTTTNGWALQVVRDPVKGLKGGQSTWRLIFMDANSTPGDTSSYVAYGDFSGGAFVEGDGIWRHVSITYAFTGGAGGFGRWELFVDGQSCGTVDNIRSAASKTNGEYGYLGGNGTLPGQVYGNFDCFVYSEITLTPDKFLCTKGGQSTDKRKAFLPLDVDATCSPAPFLRSVDGATYFYIGNDIARSDAHVPSACADGPVVSNPDLLAGEASATGAARWGTSALLSTRDERVLSLFNNGSSDMTIEGYFRRTAAIGTDWELMFTVHGEDGRCMASFRPANKIYLWDDAVSRGVDTAFDTQSWTDNVWHHLAWVRQNRAWTIYQDGVSLGTLAQNPAKTIHARELWIGGRIGEHIWRGDIAEVRISKRALAPADFLNAAKQTGLPPPPAEPDGTKAFWYLDNADGTAVLENALSAAGGFVWSGAATGVTDMMLRGNRRTDDSGAFDDTMRPNGGSVVPSAVLTSKALGIKLGSSDEFTVEGWLKLQAPLAAETLLCGTWDGTNGWKVSVLPGTDGALSIAIKAESTLNLYVEETLADAISAYKCATWFNLSVTYDPSAGNGTWTFFVDGKTVGSVENGIKPVMATFDAEDFSLGTGVAYDIWRVSRGVRSVETMLWQKMHGTIISFH